MIFSKISYSFWYVFLQFFAFFCVFLQFFCLKYQWSTSEVLWSTVKYHEVPVKYREVPWSTSEVPWSTVKYQARLSSSTLSRSAKKRKKPQKKPSFFDFCKNSNFENISYEIPFGNYIEIFVWLKSEKTTKNRKKLQENLSTKLLSCSLELLPGCS